MPSEPEIVTKILWVFLATYGATALVTLAGVAGLLPKFAKEHLRPLVNAVPGWEDRPGCRRRMI